jgi:small conductance mechanosensitive channel
MVIRTLIRTQPGEQWAAAREFRRRMKIRIDREGMKVP